MEKLMTATEAQEALRISRSKLYNDVRAGKLPAVHIGARVLFRPSTLDRWLQEQESTVAWVEP